MGQQLARLRDCGKTIVIYAGEGPGVPPDAVPLERIYYDGAASVWRTTPEQDIAWSEVE